MDSYNGVFIVIDGIDGSGKTTHSRRLCDFLCKNGFDATYTMEPSKGRIGMFIRDKIINNEKTSPEVEALLFAADRFEHLNFEIFPLLKDGKIVISDRYLYASIAYQGAQNLDLNWIDKINYFAPKPDLAIYLDVYPEIGLDRIEGAKSVFENIELQKKVRGIYLDLVKKGRLILVDGMKEVEEVDDAIISLALRTIKDKLGNIYD